MVLVQRNAIHGLLYLVVSLLAVALVFFALGAPFVAALEVIIYAGAIMVLFVFVVMVINVGVEGARIDAGLLQPTAWIGPAVLASLLLAALVAVLVRGGPGVHGAGTAIAPTDVGLALFGRYLLGVELASLLLLAGLVGAYHLGRRE